MFKLMTLTTNMVQNLDELHHAKRADSHMSNLLIVASRAASLGCFLVTHLCTEALIMMLKGVDLFLSLFQLSPAMLLQLL